MVTTRTMTLRGGSTLEVNMTPEFEALVRRQLTVNDGEELTDVHVRTYLRDAVISAVEKAEVPREER